MDDPNLRRSFELLAFIDGNKDEQSAMTDFVAESLDGDEGDNGSLILIGVLCCFSLFCDFGDDRVVTFGDLFGEF